MQDWESKAAFMRKTGATSAQWDQQDKLISLTLGPDPSTPKGETQPAHSREEQRRTFRETATRAGSRLIPRIPEPKSGGSA